jgi:hypothetical protein
MLATTKIIFKQKKYRAIFVIVSILFFALFILIPTFSIEYNTLSFQLSTFSLSEYLLMVFLALLIGVTFTLQIYTFRNKTSCSTSASVARGTATGVSGVFAAILGTAFCASCLVPLFAAVGLGTGSLFFVLEHRTAFLAGAIVLMLVSLYFALKKATATYKKANH